MPRMVRPCCKSSVSRTLHSAPTRHSRSANRKRSTLFHPRLRGRWNRARRRGKTSQRASAPATKYACASGLGHGAWKICAGRDSGIPAPPEKPITAFRAAELRFDPELGILTLGFGLRVEGVNQYVGVQKRSPRGRSSSGVHLRLACRGPRP